MSEKYIYKVVFVNQEQVYEVFVKSVYQGELHGFVILEDYVFGEKSSILVDPAEEKLRLEFEGVQRSFIPVHRVVRIDQVNQRGTAKIVGISKDGSDNAVKLASLYNPEIK